MGTFCEIKVRLCPDHDPHAVKADLTACFALGREVESCLSIYRSDSPISRFNHCPVGQDFHAEPLLLEALLLCRRAYSLSDGAFDPTVKPLLDLWGFYRKENGRVPDPAAIQACLKNVGLRYLVIDEPRGVLRKQRGIQLDLGGIGKGFAVDKMSAWLSQKGYRHFIVNLGGNLYVSGMWTADKQWRIGIKDPLGGPRPIKVVAVQDKGISTSASYYNYMDINGKTYSHIIRPSTGMPVDHRLSVTLIGSSAGLMDGLTTGFAVIGLKASLAKAAAMDNLEGILFLENQGALDEFPMGRFAEHVR